MRIDGEHNANIATQRRLVWSEHLSPEEVSDREVIELLARYGLEVAVAVRPGDEPQLPALLETAGGHGVSVHLWPMLRDADGRWLSERNAAQFSRFTETLIRVTEGATARPGLVLDLEPPIEQMRSWLRRPTRILRPREFLGRSPALSDLVAAMRDRGVHPWAAVVPLLVADPLVEGGGGWHAVMGTPIDPQSLARLSAMLYSSVAVGYGRGWLRRRDVLALLFEAARACKRRWGNKAAASVGAVGPGALGDEEVYADPRELAEDVALIRAAGIEDIGLFELRGVLRRPPAERWFDALCHTAPAARLPHRSRRALAAVGLAVGLGRLLRP